MFGIFYEIRDLVNVVKKQLSAVSLLSFMVAVGEEVSDEIKTEASATDSMKMLKWLHESKFLDLEEAAYAASCRGDTRMLKKIRKWQDINFMDVAARHGHRSTVIWYEQFYIPDHDTLNAAIYSGNLRLVRKLQDKNSLYWSKAGPKIAADNGDFDMLKLVWHDCNWKVIRNGVRSGNVEMVSWILDWFYQEPIDRVIEFVGEQDRDMFDLICNRMVSHRDYESVRICVLEWMDERSIDRTDAWRLAAENCDFEALEWLSAKYPIPEIPISDFEVLVWFIKHGIEVTAQMYFKHRDLDELICLNSVRPITDPEASFLLRLSNTIPSTIWLCAQMARPGECVSHEA